MEDLRCTPQNGYFSYLLMAAIIKNPYLTSQLSTFLKSNFLVKRRVFSSFLFCWGIRYFYRLVVGVVPFAVSVGPFTRDASSRKRAAPSATLAPVLLKLRRQPWGLSHYARPPQLLAPSQPGVAWTTVRTAAAVAARVARAAAAEHPILPFS